MVPGCAGAKTRSGSAAASASPAALAGRCGRARFSMRISAAHRAARAAPRPMNMETEREPAPFTVVKMSFIV